MTRLQAGIATMPNMNTKPSTARLADSASAAVGAEANSSGRVAGRYEIAREREAADRLTREINAEIEALILGTKTLREG